jgi:hypothetical protein
MLEYMIQASITNMGLGMKNRILTALVACLLGLNTTALLAQEPASEQALMAYYSLPFGGSSRKQETPLFGFRMDTLEDSDSGITFASFTGKPAMMDFAMTEDGPEALSFNGVNALEKTIVYNADAGTTTTTTSINWGLVAVGVVSAVAVAEWVDDDDDKCVPTRLFNFGMVYGVAVDSCGNPIDV